jgi:hypothetical protein
MNRFVFTSNGRRPRIGPQAPPQPLELSQVQRLGFLPQVRRPTSGLIPPERNSAGGVQIGRGL